MRVFVCKRIGLDNRTSDSNRGAVTPGISDKSCMYPYVGTDMIHGTIRMIIEEIFGKNSTVVYM